MDFRPYCKNIKNKPVLDEGFIPLESVMRWVESQSDSDKKIVGMNISYGDIVSTDRFEALTGNTDFNNMYLERMLKFILWMKGGASVAIKGDNEVAEHLKKIYSLQGTRGFDSAFMTTIYEQPFEVFSNDELHTATDFGKPAGGKTSGCRIGFDAGGSDMKVSAVIDGKVVYDEEIVWHPKINTDPEYHYNMIMDCLKKAASKMPRVDTIGISSAGIYVDNQCRVASLFKKVPKDLFQSKVRDIYTRAAAEIGAPLVVYNDGDVAAMAGAESFGNNLVGIAMGTSEAVGYIDGFGNIRGWLNELAFAPIDVQEHAFQDEWSGDYGVGSAYFSQDAVINLAPRAGIELDQNLPPAQKLVVVQRAMDEGSAGARKIYESIGCYLGHTLPLYQRFYQNNKVLLMGRVLSGIGGELLVDTAKKVLDSEYPECQIDVLLPDEKLRRLGQSVAAAML